MRKRWTLDAPLKLASPRMSDASTARPVSITWRTTERLIGQRSGSGPSSSRWEASGRRQPSAPRARRHARSGASAETAAERIRSTTATGARSDRSSREIR